MKILFVPIFSYNVTHFIGMQEAEAQPYLKYNYIFWTKFCYRRL